MFIIKLGLRTWIQKMQTSLTLATLMSIVDDTSSVTVEDASRGLCLKVDNKHATFTLSLFGGHVLSYINKKDNKERLWLSNKAIFDGKTPIRGGIPICWPWFSSHHQTPSFPSHGFVRTQMFKLIDIKETLSKQDVSHTCLTLAPNQMDLFGYNNIQMKLVIDISDTLNINIISMNNSNTDIAITQALHTYFKVDNINSTLLKGVTTDYDDKPSNTFANKAPKHYTFDGEVDRIHKHKHDGYTRPQMVEIFSTNINTGDEHSLLAKIKQSGHDSTVVWNPWSEKSISMNDMENEGFVNMLCIEAANTQNADNPLQLKPCHIHRLSQTIY